VMGRQHPAVYMSSKALPSLIATAALAFAGCANGSPTEPTAPVEILATKYTLGCGKWSPAVPPVRRTVVDMQFTGEETTLNAGLEAIRLNGGVVTHIFAVGGYVRAEIDVERLLPLNGPPSFFLWHAVTVSNPASFRVAVIVGLDHPVTDEDVKAAEALGATIRRRFTIINAYSAEIDDSQVPLLRALPGVRYVEDNGFGCVGGAQTTKEPGN
jgi:hypothetical protein